MKVSFRTADGKRVSFNAKSPKRSTNPKRNSKGRKRNPPKGKVPPQLRPYLFKKGHGKKKFKKGAKSTKRARRCSPSRPSCPIPKGKRKGDIFTSGGNKYRVVSFVRNGKRVRYAAKA